MRERVRERARKERILMDLLSPIITLHNNDDNIDNNNNDDNKNDDDNTTTHR